MTTSTSRNLDVFRSTVEVMLIDGRLTREEKRLTIKLASALGLTAEQPADKMDDPYELGLRVEQ